jgi:hypothetical protein
MTMDTDDTRNDPPTDDVDEGVTARQLLHAATGDRDAEARALADRADDDVDEDAARTAVGRAHGELARDGKPESDIADPDDARDAQD